MQDSITVNRITKWENVVNLTEDNPTIEDLQQTIKEQKEQIKNLEEIITTLKQKLNAYEGDSITSYEEVYGDITD